MAAEIIKEAYTEKKVDYELLFDDGNGNGYGFNCDRNGNLLPMHECAVANYQYCMDHPEEFVRFNEVNEIVTRIRHGATIRCRCGNEMELYDEYRGACECRSCHQWYNLFGQCLVPPESWESDDEEPYECYDEEW